ncbi:MAG: ribonuclease J, partial [Spirochaetota bacterium]
KVMYSLIKPKFFMPIHGEFRHLVLHATLAEDMGMKGSNIIVAQDGDVIELNNESIKRLDPLDLQLILVDGKGVGDIGTRVLRDRQVLSENGVVVVIVAIKDNKLISKSEVISRGFVYVKENTDMMGEACKIVDRLVRDSLKEQSDILESGKLDYTSLKAKIKGSLRNFFFNKVERKPMLLVRIIDVV